MWAVSVLNAVREPDQLVRSEILLQPHGRIGLEDDILDIERQNIPQILTVLNDLRDGAEPEDVRIILLILRTDVMQLDAILFVLLDGLRLNNRRDDEDAASLVPRATHRNDERERRPSRERVPERGVAP